MDFGHFWEKYFSTIFWTRRQNPDLEVQNPDLFMTELPCHQLGAKIKLFVLTVRPESTYQHQKSNFLVDMEKWAD